MNWKNLSHWFVDKLQGSVPVDVQEAQNAGSELTFTTRSDLPVGTRVRVTLPSGTTMAASINWRRRNPSGPEHVVALDIPEVKEPLSLPQATCLLRRSPRFPHRQWVYFEEGPRLGTVTADLSVEGCRLEADLEDHIGECHLISLELPGTSRAVRATAKILWSRGNHSGLRFLNMHVDDEAALSRSLGLTNSRTQECWSDLWRKSLDGLTYRLTPSPGEVVSLDIQLPNWLVTFQLSHWASRGDPSGAFTTFDVRRKSPELRALRQQLGISLNDPAKPIYLEFRNSQGDSVLALWGLERYFTRVPLNGSLHLTQP